MIRLAGGVILVVSAVIWGRRQGESVKKRCALTAALCDFVRYTGERIETFREPLCDIFSSYKDDVLSDCGFIAALRESGAAAAVAAIRELMLPEDAAIMESFAKKLGTTYEAGQRAMCEYTASALGKSARVQKEELSQRLRLFRVLPALAAASAVILFI